MVLANRLNPVPVLLNWPVGETFVRARSQRLEVRLPGETVEQLRREAQRRQVSIAQIVRDAIDALLIQDRANRVRAAEALFQIGAPVADWSQMKNEIDASMGPNGGK